MGLDLSLGPLYLYSPGKREKVTHGRKKTVESVFLAVLEVLDLPVDRTLQQRAATRRQPR
jgi:hypothetical protein